MEQKVITAFSATQLNEKIAQHIKDGWQPVGSHIVVCTISLQETINRKQFSHEYSQTMKK